MVVDSPIRCLPEHLVPVKQLGKGTYGAVYLCEDRERGLEVAVKHIKNPAQCRKCILREVILLARLRHENLVYLLDFVQVPTPDFKEVLLVMPYVKSNLHRVLRSKEDLTNKHVQAIVCQIFRGLAYLHATGVAHRDLKPGNVLIDQSCKVKICDFGLARGDMFEDGTEKVHNDFALEFTEYVVTRYYRAPEVMLLPRKYTSAVDIWSVGCILGECYTRKPLFTGRSHLDMLKFFLRICGTPSREDIAWVPAEGKSILQQCGSNGPGKPQLEAMLPNAPPAACNLAKQLLAWNPASRPLASEAQEHEYLHHLLPRTPQEVPETFDWSFDTFRPTVQQVQERLYSECAYMHPEIVDRDKESLVRLGFFKETRHRPVPHAMDRRPLRSVTPPPLWSRRSMRGAETPGAQQGWLQNRAVYSATSSTSTCESGRRQGPVPSFCSPRRKNSVHAEKRQAFKDCDPEYGSSKATTATPESARGGGSISIPTSRAPSTVRGISPTRAPSTNFPAFRSSHQVQDPQYAADHPRCSRRWSFVAHAEQAAMQRSLTPPRGLVPDQPVRFVAPRRQVPNKNTRSPTPPSDRRNPSASTSDQIMRRSLSVSESSRRRLAQAAIQSAAAIQPVRRNASLSRYAVTCGSAARVQSTRTPPRARQEDTLSFMPEARASARFFLAVA